MNLLSNLKVNFLSLQGKRQMSCSTSLSLKKDSKREYGHDYKKIINDPAGLENKG